ncbi:MAG: DUF1365 domain-containing protein [Paracoccaceae bacterium]
MKPELLQSHTYHKRLGGPDNAFRYSIDYVLCEPEAKSALPYLLSRNRFNLAAIHDCDHGGPVGRGQGASWVRQVLAEHGLTDLAEMRVLLVAQPRVLGFVFNPVSFWLVVDQADALKAVIAEVNNTYGQRHSYLCAHDDMRPIRPTDTLTAQKVFYVSPFQNVAGRYDFRFDYQNGHFGARIDFRDGNKGLVATLTGSRRSLGSTDILWSVIKRPFGSLRVLALIYFQAMVLRAKGAGMRPLPPEPETEVTR